MELRAGLQIDRYVLIEPLGEGGQGAVWKARDPLAPDQPCALKLVPVIVGRPHDLERTRREARALAQLDHPSLVRSVSLFEDLKLGVLGIAMELVQGTSLRQLSREGKLGVHEKHLVLEHVARALCYLHQNGVVHRDVKLDNVLVRDSFFADPTRPDGVKVVDLGIAAVPGTDQQLTQEGTVVGTIPYLAPELLDPATFEGEQSSPRVDVFAFGVMGWLLLADRHPTGLPANSNAVDYTRSYRKGTAPSAGFPQGEVDGEWRAILTRCLALTPSERLPTASAVLEAITGTLPDSVVVRPSRDGGRSPATAVATPQAMFDPTVLAERPPTGPTAQVSTVELGPVRPAPATTRWTLPALTVLLAVGIGTGVALLTRESPRTAPPSVKATASAEQRAARKPADAAPPASDAAPASAAPEASAPVVAPADACHEGCPSGRSCGGEGCDAPLDPAEVYALRLGRVDANAEGASLLATYRTAEVCVSVTGKTPVCMPLLETTDGGVTRKSVAVSYAELAKEGLDVTVRHVVPGTGDAELAHKSGVKLDGARRELLCKGLVIDGLTAGGDVSVAKVVLYLDEPDTAPKRCE